MTEPTHIPSDTQRFCACPSDDAKECVRIRYPRNRVGMNDSIESMLDQPCECCCHEYEIEYDDEF